ncbi:hypothetical protein N183_37980 [Sinorhizobium sp. Sb3]|nr:hypothetical protein N183_37980 [Sinorhizobium sp. Sb3]
MGHQPKSNRLAPKVLALIGQGRSYRWIARDLAINKNTVAGIAKRQRNSANQFVDEPMPIIFPGTE